MRLKRLDADRGAEMFQHLFGMVAGGFRLDHGRASGRIESRKEDSDLICAEATGGW